MNNNKDSLLNLARQGVYHSLLPESIQKKLKEAASTHSCDTLTMMRELDSIASKAKEAHKERFREDVRA